MAKYIERVFDLEQYDIRAPLAIFQLSRSSQWNPFKPRAQFCGLLSSISIILKGPKSMTGFFTQAVVKEANEADIEA